jgi:hypothetical protein
MTTPPTGAPAEHLAAAAGRSGRLARAAVWLPGLVVAVAAAVATVHGLYEVAGAAGVPPEIAWLYPLITDGLALVAYTATARLTGGARRYAWFVVALAAGLSGLAQAAYLASAASSTGGAVGGPVGAAPTFDASAELRFGVGAWPAVAAAIVAHLLYILAVDHGGAEPCAQLSPATPRDTPAMSRPVVGLADGRVPDGHLAAVQPGVQRGNALALTTAPSGTGVQPAGTTSARHRSAALNTAPAIPMAMSRAVVSPARDRAAATATAYRTEHGRLPTVSALADRADVSRGTAATALRDLRD